MFTLLIFLDHQTLFAITRLPHPMVLEWFALWLSGIGMGGLIWLLISIWLFAREERRDHSFFLQILSALAATELVTNIFLKHFFARPRPLGAALTDYSFPSGHATFAWSLAIILAAKEPRAKYLFYLLALLISLSRVYLGMHYPADVVAGSLVGVAIGLVVQYGYDKVKRKGTAHHAGRRKRRARH